MPLRNDHDSFSRFTSVFQKAIVVIMLLVMLSTMSLAVDCTPGKDGYCQPECREVDFDCVNNPNQEVYVAANDSQQAEPSFQDTENTVSPASNAIEKDGAQLQRSTEEDEDADDSPTDTFLLIAAVVGAVLLLAITLVIVRRYEIQKGMAAKEYKMLVTYIRNVRAQGYKDEAIRRTLLKRAYSKEIVDKAFKALEERP